MGDWSEVLKEINEAQSQYDYVRRKYISDLYRITGRNVITYYSGWLSKQCTANVDINDSDMVGFMNCVNGLDCSKGLDLILHTPGGSPNAAEAIINYLRNKFQKDIRVIVPQLAMSAGTMMACASKIIIMGEQSSLGPIDPQFNGKNPDLHTAPKSGIMKSLQIRSDTSEKQKQITETNAMG